MKSLPILEQPACVAVAGGLSDEQVQVAREMRALKRELRALRRNATDGDVARREGELRQRWTELVGAREDAWKRKMRALGYDV